MKRGILTLLASRIVGFHGGEQDGFIYFRAYGAVAYNTFSKADGWIFTAEDPEEP